MTGNGGTHSQDRLDETSDSDFEDVLGRYLDRLTEGDFLDPEEVRASHPRFGEALLEHLAAKLFIFEWLHRKETAGANAGEIVLLAGMPEGVI